MCYFFKLYENVPWAGLRGVVRMRGCHVGGARPIAALGTFFLKHLNRKMFFFERFTGDSPPAVVV